MRQKSNLKQREKKSISKEDIEHVLQKAEHLRRKKQYQEGINLLVDALEAGILKSKIYYGLGNIYYDAGKLDLAEYAYKRAITFDPEHVNAHNNLSVVYRRKGNMDASVKMVKKVYLLELKHLRQNKVSPEQKRWAHAIALKQGIFLLGIGALIFVVIYILGLIFK